MKTNLLSFGQWFSFILLVLITVSSQGQDCKLRISGQILHAETKEPMAFANVALKELSKGAIADENGQYVIENLCAGIYTIVCSRVGCDHAEHQVTLSENKSLNFDFLLSLRKPLTVSIVNCSGDFPKFSIFSIVIGGIVII